MGRVDGKAYLVTGAARGQGAAEATLLAEEGATVLITDVLDAEGEELAKQLRDKGLAAHYHSLDVTDEASWVAVGAWAIEKAGRLDGLVNNAGIGGGRGVIAETRESWDRVLSVNLTGPMLGTKVLAPLMAETDGGSIVNVSSIAGMMGYYGAAYSSSKWALLGLTKCCALELAPLNIRVNSIHPGYIRTPMVGAATPGMIKSYETVAVQRRSAAPEEVAPLVLFLLSDESLFITGSEVAIDGGLTGAGIAQSLLEFGEMFGGAVAS